MHQVLLFALIHHSFSLVLFNLYFMHYHPCYIHDHLPSLSCFWPILACFWPKDGICHPFLALVLMETPNFSKWPFYAWYFKYFLQNKISLYDSCNNFHHKPLGKSCWCHVKGFSIEFSIDYCIIIPWVIPFGVLSFPLVH